MNNVYSIIVIALLVISCTSEDIHEEIQHSTIENAVAVVHSINSSVVSGTVNFEKVENGIRVSANLSGLTGSKHGFHIHQYGNCSAEDGTSAGGHFNPNENDHSSPESINRHMGDMGNIMADENGNASLEYVDTNIKMYEIIGRGIIVHGGEDDLESQPSGAAGPRIGCGVIGIQQ